MLRWFCLLSLVFLPCLETTSVDNYYCHDDNCYELLGLERDANKTEIKKAFRSRAAKTHPDKFLDPKDKAAAEIQFKKLATAQDVLRDAEVRADYDYMLDHPDQFYLNYYKAWRRRNYPNVDVRLVIIACITIISYIQWQVRWSRYGDKVKQFAATPMYRNKAVEMAKEQGIWTTTDKKKLRGVSKTQQKEDEEKIIRQVIEENIDIRGDCAKPTPYDTLWLQLALLPVQLWRLAAWHAMWTYRFRVCGLPYEEVHKLYLIRKNLGMAQGQFDALEEHERKAFLREELWKSDVFAVWKEHKDEATRVSNASNSKHKAYRRAMKNGGAGRMYFDDS